MRQSFITIDAAPLQESRCGARLAKLICDIAGVHIAQTQDGQIPPRWDWSAPTGAASKCGLESELQASIDAVEALFPRHDWAHAVGSSSTHLSYFEWALAQAECQHQNEPEMAVERQSI